jgi:hypothetical protein
MTPRLATALIVGAALLAGASAAHAKQTRPLLRTITVQPSGPAGRSVTVTTAGPRFRSIYVCDFVTSECFRARRTATSIWLAALPASDPTGPYNLGVIGRAAGRYVIAQVGDAPVANVTPHNGV